MKATFSEESIRIEEADLLIDLSIAAIWLTPAIPQPVFSRKSVIANLQATVNSYLAIKEPDGLAVLLPHLQGYSKKPALDETLQPVWEKIQKIRTALQQGEVKTLVKAFSALLGQGRGLTPAGDDCITGVLLGLIRSSSQIFTPLEIYYLKETILSEAFQRTTALSACQIEAAAEGSADLRLINALDGILTGSPESTACAIQLSDYGHSSGGDALVGFVAALGNPVS
ncbi:MAG TPA: DUF2877 domain-containing protein [Longilinea sp.]|nr:DUF2877 domain-containing protein [Longilinea sp.]